MSLVGRLLWGLPNPSLVTAVDTATGQAQQGSLGRAVFSVAVNQQTTCAGQWVVERIIGTSGQSVQT